MSAQKKINQDYTENGQRPNIDHLISRIMTERRREKRANVITIVLVLAGAAALAVLFTQN